MKGELLIAGGTGLIGSALKEEAWRQGWIVTLLSRKSGPGHIVWNPSTQSISLTEVRSFDIIINLAGASLAGKRWTVKSKNDIVASRTNSASTLEKYLGNGLLQTRLYIGASAIGIYGDHGMQRVDESTPVEASDHWMVNTVLTWEAGHLKIESLGIRTSIIRIGIVLSTKGGALKEILQTTPFGILTYFGNGRQIWPWIHMDDLVRIFFYCMNTEHTSGTYLAVAPQPTSNRNLAKIINKQFSLRRVVMQVPVFALSVLLGEMHMALLQSCNGYPSRLLAEGFDFRFKNIEEALADLIRK